jgi:hypothetical protein
MSSLPRSRRALPGLAALLAAVLAFGLAGCNDDGAGTRDGGSSSGSGSGSGPGSGSGSDATSTATPTSS